MQTWIPCAGGEITSLSKNQAQLDETIQALILKPDSVNYEKAAEPDGSPLELDIPDDLPFADMVENGTVFLHDDEMDIVWDRLNSNN